VAARKGQKIIQLEQAIGYKFKDKDLARRAVTHASVKSDGNRYNNERLEFLGDRVLGLVIAEVLWRADPTAREGDLARRYNRLVRRETCASVARRIDLGTHLNLSESEAGSGGRDKDTILADAMEAVLGAVFIDGNFDRARNLVETLWADEINGGVAVTADPKSSLQEWAQGIGRPLPVYREVERTGPDHAPVFVAEVRIDGSAPARGEGPSKRQAEQEAATNFLEREGIALGGRTDA